MEKLRERWEGWCQGGSGVEGLELLRGGIIGIEDCAGVGEERELAGWMALMVSMVDSMKGIGSIEDKISVLEEVVRVMWGVVERAAGLRDRLEASPEMIAILEQCVQLVSILIESSTEVLTRCREKLSSVLCVAMAVGKGGSQMTARPELTSLSSTTNSVCRKVLLSSGRFRFFHGLLELTRTDSLPPVVLLGAVRILNTYLWGPSDLRVDQLRQEIPVVIVISAFGCVVHNGQREAVIEVGASLKRLVKRFGQELFVEWEAIIELLRDAFEMAKSIPSLVEAVVGIAELHLGTTAVASRLLEKGHGSAPILEHSRLLLASTDEANALFDLYKDLLSEKVVTDLLKKRGSLTEPWLGLEEWLHSLSSIADTFYLNEGRPGIRRLALEIVGDAALVYAGLYGDRVVDEVVLKLLQTKRQSGGVGLSSEGEILHLVAKLLTEMPLSDIDFSSLLGELETPARVDDPAAYPLADEAVASVSRLFFRRIDRPPAPRAIVAFRSLVAVHMHSHSPSARKIALEEVSHISADAGYFIVARKKRQGVDINSRILVSHVSQRRSTQDSISHFPVQLLVSNLLIRVRAEEEQDLLEMALDVLIQLLRNPFLSRDCDLRSLATALCDDLEKARPQKDQALWKNAGPRARRRCFDVFHLLLGYGLQRLGHEEDLWVRVAEAVNRELLWHLSLLSTNQEQALDETDVPNLVRYVTAAVVSQPLLAPTLSATLVRTLQYVSQLSEIARIAILEAVTVLGEHDALRRVWEDDASLTTVAVDGIYWTLTDPTKGTVDDNSSTLGIGHRVLTASEDPSSRRWRYLCFCAFVCITTSLKPLDVDRCVGRILLDLRKDRTMAACAEYGSYFVEGEPRSRSVSPTPMPIDAKSCPYAWMERTATGPVLLSVAPNADGSAEFVLRRSTGNSVFRFKQKACDSDDYDELAFRESVPTVIRAALSDQVIAEGALGQDPVSETDEESSPTETEEVTPDMDLYSRSPLAEISIAGEDSGPLLRQRRRVQPAEDKSLSGIRFWEALRRSIPQSVQKCPVIVPSLLKQLLVDHGGGKPVYLEDERSRRGWLEQFNRHPPKNCHRIGVVYVGETSLTEVEILQDVHGSQPYSAFLRDLGSFSRLANPPRDMFTGGLDRSGRNEDGEFFLHWEDRCTQVTFHVPTLMPGKDIVSKKRHIGNDHVNIIWIERGDDYDSAKLPSQFNSVHILVFPSGYGVFRVFIRVNERMKGVSFGPLQPLVDHVVEKKSLGPLIRETAINADAACISNRESPSGWEQRMMQLQNLASKLDLTPSPWATSLT